MPDCFLEAPNGVVYDFNGIDKVVRWDGITAATEVAGITPPVSAPTIGASPTPGPIVGTFYAYVRFKDRYGNVSNVSPISNKLEPLTEVGTRITGATNASPIVITTASAHGLGTGQIVKIEGCYGNAAANDIWTVTVLSATTFSLDDSTGSGVYNSGGHVYTGTAKIIYTNVPVPTDTKVTKRQILRNQDGDLDTFYVDVETTDLTGDHFESMQTSEDLAGAEGVAIVDLDGTDLAISRYTVPPSRYATACLHGGRFFAAVIEPYAEGSISLTNGSKTVNGMGVEWNHQTFPGRYLTVRGETRRYEIDYLNSTTQLVLKDAYAGTTDPFARYEISPDVTQYRRGIAWSEAGLYEAWPPTNVRQLPNDSGSGELTRIFSQDSFVYIGTENWIYRFSFYKGPNRDGFFSIASNRGLCNHRCAVSIGGTTYCLDYLGVHAFSGNDDMPVSDVLSDLFRTQPNTTYRINWAAKKYFHAVHDHGEGVIKWYVALSGEYTPRHALVLDYRRKRWAFEHSPYPVGASCLGQLNGRSQVFLGTRAKRVMAANYGSLDGPDPGQGTIRGTVTTAGPGWIADSSASFPSSGLVGYPVSIVSGRGRGQQGLIHTVSGTTLYIRGTWNVRPDTTSVYQIGGVNWRLRTGWYRWSDSPQSINREISLLFQKLSRAGTLHLRVYDDGQDDPLDAVETKPQADGNGVGTTRDEPWLDVLTTKQNGAVRVPLTTFREWGSDAPQFVSVELAGVQGQDRQQVWGLNIAGAQDT